MKNYLIKIKNFLKYGFIDENVSFLGMSKFDKNQGSNDSELCVLAYEKLHSNYTLVKCRKEGKK